MATSTRDTTRTEPLAVVLLAAVLGAALIVTAVPLAMPAWQFAQSEPRYLDVVRGKPAGMLELDALTRSLRASSSRADLSRAAFVQMVAAQQLGLKSFRALSRLMSARRDLRLGLAAAPSDAYAWTRLAVAELELGNPREAAAALAMALQLAPSERGLTALHFDLGVVLWGHLDQRAKQSIAQRLRWAAHVPELAHVVAGNSAMALKSKMTSSR